MSEHQHPNYKKVYLTLLVLLVVSVAGPFVGIAWVTLLTAFGIAFVKANLVVQNFMHLRWERRIMKWMLATSVVLMLLLVAGVAPDVMEHEGQRWVNTAAIAAVERGVEGGHGEDEGHTSGVEEYGDQAAGGVGRPGPVPPGAGAGAEQQDFGVEEAYRTYCASCHGEAGDGGGPAASALNPPPADFADAGFWEARTDEEAFTAVKMGGAAVGRSPLMMGFGGSLDDSEIRAIVAYLRTFASR